MVLYYDDILNVNAYLRQKMKNNMSKTQKLIYDFQRLDSQFDKMHYDTDILINEMQQIAENMGIDVSDIVKKEEKRSLENIGDCVELLVRLPDDYNFSSAFQKLCEEAHEAGFTDVHPEELLSEEEMKAAEDFSQALDARFEMETGMTTKDLSILTAAIVIRVVCYYGFRLLEKNGELNSEASLKMAQEFAAHDFMPIIRGERQILFENVPFDLPDNRYFKRSEILGFHPQMGWLIGVMNILTSTVTTSKRESYSVIHTLKNLSDFQIDSKVSTLVHVVYPVLRNLSDSKDALLAAVVREADVLKVTKAPIQDVFRLLDDTIVAEVQNIGMIEKCQRLAASSSFDFEGVVRDAETASFINKLITAVHAVQYDPVCDGDVRMYAVRTNKVLAISNAIAAMINSIPSIISRDLNKLDFAGILSTCLSAFSSTKFWIEVKSNYLVSAYKQEIDKQMEMIDRYFQGDDLEEK